MQTVSLKNTKQEILAAYEELLREAEGDVTLKAPSAAIKSMSGHFQKAIEILVIVKSSIDDAVTNLEQQKIIQTQSEEQTRLELAQFHTNLKRAKEEFDYEFKRRRQEKIDELETEIVTKRRQFETEIAQKNESLRLRAESISQQENELRELRKRVELYPKELERAIQEAVAATRKEEQTKARVESDLLEKQTEGENALAKLQIENLEKTAKDQADEIRILKSQLERATAQVKDIAVSVIDSQRPLPTQTVNKSQP